METFAPPYVVRQAQVRQLKLANVVLLCKVARADSFGLLLILMTTCCLNILPDVEIVVVI